METGAWGPLASMMSSWPVELIWRAGLWLRAGQKTGPYAADCAPGLRPQPNTPGYPSGPENLRTPALVRGGLAAPASLYI